MMGTHAELDGKENVAVMQFMETESLKLAKKKQFAGIFTTNTSPLTQVIILMNLFVQENINNQIIIPATWIKRLWIQDLIRLSSKSV